MTESKRVKSFRLALAKKIPKFPNNRASLQALQAKSLGALLIDYGNWAARYIAPRARQIVVEQTAINDPRWKLLAAEIEALLQKIKEGEDLTPYLSLQPHTRGFTPAASAPGPNAERWADKDLLLNVMGYHHLHLDAAPSNKLRSDDVLFVETSRETLTVVGIFNHKVFEHTSLGAALNAERDALWKIFDERTSRGMPQGSVYIPTMIATSGHSINFVMSAAEYARVVARIDPHLDDPNYVRGLYEHSNISAPKSPKVKWHMQFLDLGLLDEKNNLFFSLRKGPN